MDDFQDFKRFANAESIASAVWMKRSDRPMSTDPSPELKAEIALITDVVTEVLSRYHNWSQHR